MCFPRHPMEARPCRDPTCTPLTMSITLYPSIVSRDLVKGQRFSLGISWIISQKFKRIRSISFQNGSIQSACITFQQTRLISVMEDLDRRYHKPSSNLPTTRTWCASSRHPMEVRPCRDPTHASATDQCSLGRMSKGLPCSRTFHPLVMHIHPEYPHINLKNLSFGSLSHVLHPQSTRPHDVIAFQQRDSQHSGCPSSSPSWERRFR